MPKTAETVEKIMTDREVKMGYIRTCHCGETYGFTVFAYWSCVLAKWTKKHLRHCTIKEIKRV